VGIGSNFDGISGPTNGLDDVSKMPALIAVLMERGYADRDLKKILGGNHLRVIREVTCKSTGFEKSSDSSEGILNSV
jgi:membrane dipeptidase